MGLGFANPDRGCLGGMIQNECCKWIQEVRAETRFCLNWKWRTGWISLDNLFFHSETSSIKFSWVECLCGNCSAVHRFVNVFLNWCYFGGFCFVLHFLVIKCLLENLEEEVRLMYFRSPTPTCMGAQPLSCVQLLFNPMDCSLPGSTVHGISQAKILEQAALS